MLRASSVLNEPGSPGKLRAVLEAAAAENGGSMSAYTVLAIQNDPYRIDTPAGHRNGAWLAMQIDRLKLTGRRIHLRGLHYALVASGDAVKPDGKLYINDEPDWLWLQGVAAKSARWLGYVPFDQIVDQRNAPPIIHRARAEAPSWRVAIGGFDIEVPPIEDLRPEILTSGFIPRQPYHFAIFGEKNSILEVIEPIAREHHADIYLPSGEISDSLLYQMARDGAEDGRPMIVLTLADFDPAGSQMSVSIGHKLRAFRDLSFPHLEFEVHPVALTAEQVRVHGLPSTPLKETERRADRWRAAFGVEQTEIDALATLRPRVLRKIVRDAIEPFVDPTLEERASEAEAVWTREAQAILDDHIDDDVLEEMRARLEEKLEEIRPQIDELTRELNGFDGMPLDVPPIELPAPEAIGKPLASALIASSMSFADAASRLIARKAYADGAAGSRARL